MIETKEKKKDWKGDEVEVLGATYEEGVAKDADRWRGKMRNREEMMSYIKSSFRYWYAKDEEVFGSEKRKTPA